MIIYNRRKRRVYDVDSSDSKVQVLDAARQALDQGSATPAQRALVEGLRDEELAWAKRKAARHAGSRFMWWFHGEFQEAEDLKEQRTELLYEAQRLEQQNAQREAAAAKNGIAREVHDATVNAATRTADGGTADAKTHVQSGRGGPLDGTASSATVSANRAVKGVFSRFWPSKQE